MAIERINSAFDIPALKQEFTEFREGLGLSEKALVSLYETIKSYKGSTLQNIVANTEKLDQATLKALSSQDKLNRSIVNAERAKAQSLKTQQQQIKNEVELEKKTQATNRTKETAAKVELTLMRTKLQLAKAHETEKAALDKVDNAYEQMKKQYNDASALSKRRGAELLQIANGNEKVYKSLLGQDEVYQAATDAAQRYYKQLDLLETEVGQYQRRVGQYERANWGLNNSINQLTRELPAFANSLQTGFMAISNNLPIFVDEIRSINEENKRLAADGQKPVSTLKQLGKAFVSWGTVLSIGITLLTIYGAKLVEMVVGLFDSSVAMKKAQEEAVKLNEAYKELNDNLKDFDANVRDTFNNNQLTRRLQILQAEGKARSELLQAEQGIADRRAIIAQEELNRSQQQGQSLEKLQKKYSEASREYEQFLQTNTFNGEQMEGEDLDRTLRYLKSKLDATKDAFLQQKGVEDEYYDAMFERANKQREIEAFNAEQSRKLTLETAKINAQAVIDSNQAILNDERSTLEQRLAAIRKIAEAQKASAAAELTNTLNDPAAEQADRLIATKQYAREAKQVEREAAKAIYDTRLEFANRSLAAQKQVDSLRIEQAVATKEELAGQEAESVERRIGLANEITRLQQEQVQKDYDYQKQLLDQKAAADGEYEALEAEKNAKLAATTANGQKRILDILQSAFDAQQNLQQQSLDAIALNSQKIAVASAGEYAADLAALGDQLKAKKISYDRYKQEVEQLDKAYRIKQVQREADTLAATIQQYDSVERHVADVQAKIAETEAAAGKERNEQRRAEINNLLELYKKELDVFLKKEGLKAQAMAKYQELLAEINKLQAELGEQESTKFLRELEGKLQAFQQITNNLFNAVGELQSIGIERRKVELEELEAAQQKAYENEVARIVASGATEEEKANKLKVLEAERQAQKEANDRKQRKLEIERARFQRASDIAGIISGTALAVVSALATKGPFAIPLAITIGAMGAAQLAKAIAVPLPRYEEGTASAKGGWAITDEAGPEMYVEPGGRTFLGSDQGPTMRYLKPGTRVIPADEVNDMMHRAMLAQWARQMESASGTAPDKDDKALMEIREAIVLQTEQMIREMRRNKRQTPVNNTIDLGWHFYIKSKTFN